MATLYNIPARVSTRMTSTLKRFQPVLSSALARDVNESDTAMIVTDMLAEIFGYDKFHEVTSEHQIRSTYCDLAVTLEGQLRLLLEVKAIGLDLKEKHLRQAVNYAANQGCDWVVLTNGALWQIFKVDFAKPIREELVFELDLLNANPKDPQTLDCLYMLSKEGVSKGLLPEYYNHKQATSRFILGAIVLSDPVVGAVKRELKKVSPGIKVSVDQVRQVLEKEVLKREVTEGEKAEEIRKKVQKCLGREAKAKAPKSTREDEGPPDTSGEASVAPATGEEVDPV